jgi:NAD-dependent deacetylase
MASTDAAAIAAMLRAARHIVVLTGAGISTESGIPDFRGPQGVWTKDPSAEKRATLSHYMSSRDVRVQAWRGRVDNPMFVAQPNAGHHALARIAQLTGDAFGLLVTQNVDGLHLDAGHAPDTVVEIHGNVREAKCMACGWRGPMGDVLDRVRAGEDDPPCEHCGGILKSATISFGENLVPDDLERSQVESMRADLFLALGTTLTVYPAAGLPELALRAGADLVVMNAEPTPYDSLASVVIRDPLGTALTAVADQLEGMIPR